MSATITPPQQTETFVCPNEMCGSTIPQGHVVSRVDTRLVERNLIAYCVNCKHGLHAKYQMVGFAWTLDGKIDVLTKGRLFNSIRKHVQTVSGDVEQALAG